MENRAPGCRPRAAGRRRSFARSPVEQFVDSLPFGGHGLHDRRASAVACQARAWPRSSRSTRSAPGWSALLMTKTSAISMMPALIACTSSPMPGTSTTTVTCARRGDLDFVLTHADGFDEHVVFAGGVHQQRQVGGGARQAAEAAARGHGADEDAGVGVVLLHADAVAQNGAAGDAAGGIDRDDARRVLPSRRSAAASASTSVLLPAPGGPVMPTIRAWPAKRRQFAQRRRALAGRGSRCRWRRGPARARRLRGSCAPSSVISFSEAAARSPGAGSRWCLRRWCRASRRGRTSPPG